MKGNGTISSWKKYCPLLNLRINKKNGKMGTCRMTSSKYNDSGGKGGRAEVTWSPKNTQTLEGTGDFPSGNSAG